MNSSQFLRQLRKYAKTHGLPLEVDKKLGKGGHIQLRLGNKSTTLPTGSKELRTGTFMGMLKQLEINPRDF